MSEISKNLQAVREAISKTAKEYNQPVESISLIAVSKKQPNSRIEEMLNTGHRVYGENRVQEAQQRWEHRRASYSDLELHLIGSLQTNKAKDAVSLFDYIHTVDRPKLVRALAKEMRTQDKYCPCFIQVNTGEEEQKSGVLSQNLPDLLQLCREEKLPIIGLMCIPPVDETVGVHFAFLKKLAKQHDLEKLSMGMSSDFEKAIPLGATHIRVGTSLFGVRTEK